MLIFKIINLNSKSISTINCRGPDLDEFGNPLDDIHSTDTTRFELGTGGDADERKCPIHWYQYRDSCYKFTRSPELGRDEASELCREYRHQATVRTYTYSNKETKFLFVYEYCIHYIIGFLFSGSCRFSKHQ